MLRNISNKGFFDLLSVNFLTQFLGFGSSLLVAKFLDPVEFGQIKIIQSYINIFALLAGFGLNIAVLRFCAENRAAAEKEYILKLATKGTVFSSLLVLILLGFLVFFNVITSSSQLGLWLLIYAVGIPFIALSTLLMVYLQALKKVKQMARVQAIIKVQSVLIIIMATWAWGFRGFIFSTIIAYVIGLIPLIKQVGMRFLEKAKYKTIPSDFWAIAIIGVLASGINMLGQHTDIFILDHFSNEREKIGYYSFATLFILGASQVTHTVQSISTPYFSEKGANKSWFYQKLFQTQIRMVLLSIVVALGVYLIAWFIIPFFYGENYTTSLIYLRILLIKYILWSSHAIIRASLIGLGLMRYILMVLTLSVPMGGVLAYFFTTRIWNYGRCLGTSFDKCGDTPIRNANRSYCFSQIFPKMTYKVIYPALKLENEIKIPTASRPASRLLNFR